MDIESMAVWLVILGYGYGDIASYAIAWDCSFEQAIQKLFQGQQ